VLYNRVVDVFSGMGSRYAFKNSIKINYPTFSIMENLEDRSTSSLTPYANPLSQKIHIYEGWFTSDTLLHELMHIWTYQNVKDESLIAAYLVSHGTTHGIVEDSAVAFHEGFAEFGMLELMELMFGQSYQRKSRAGLIQSGINDLADVEFSDLGWETLLSMMTDESIPEYDLNTASGLLAASRSNSGLCVDGAYDCCDWYEMDFKDVLRIIMSKEDGNDLAWKDMNFDGYFDRVRSVFSDFSDSDADFYLDLIDPCSASNPLSDPSVGGICDYSRVDNEGTKKGEDDEEERNPIIFVGFPTPVPTLIPLPMPTPVIEPTPEPVLY
jgi:hypothetical protein